MNTRADRRRQRRAAEISERQSQGGSGQVHELGRVLTEKWERRIAALDSTPAYDTYNVHSLAREVETCLEDLRAEMAKHSNGAISSPRPEKLSTEGGN